MIFSAILSWGLRFDQTAAQLAPGFKPFEYRWAALRLRKEAKKARSRAAVLTAPKRFSEKTPIAELQIEDLDETPGLYLVSDGPSELYVGEAANLRRRLGLQFAPRQIEHWAQMAKSLTIQTLVLDRPHAGKTCLAKLSGEEVQATTATELF